jgi:hypothetical protein
MRTPSGLQQTRKGKVPRYFWQGIKRGMSERFKKRRTAVKQIQLRQTQLEAAVSRQATVPGWDPQK